jgi:hypothetical protein
MIYDTVIVFYISSVLAFTAFTLEPLFYVCPVAIYN